MLIDFATHWAAPLGQVKAAGIAGVRSSGSRNGFELSRNCCRWLLLLVVQLRELWPQFSMAAIRRTGADVNSEGELQRIIEISRSRIVIQSNLKVIGEIQNGVCPVTCSNR